jgi:hypothetical protein
MANAGVRTGVGSTKRMAFPSVATVASDPKMSLRWGPSTCMITDEPSIASSMPSCTPAYEKPLKYPSDDSPVARSYALIRRKTIHSGIQFRLAAG